MRFLATSEGHPSEVPQKQTKILKLSNQYDSFEPPGSADTAGTTSTLFDFYRQFWGPISLGIGSGDPGVGDPANGPGVPGTAPGVHKINPASPPGLVTGFSGSSPKAYGSKAYG